MFLRALKGMLLMKEHLYVEGVFVYHMFVWAPSAIIEVLVSILPYIYINTCILCYLK